MTDSAIIQRLELLTNTVHTLTAMLGARLTRMQMMERLGVSDNTLRKLEHNPGFPRRDSSGKYLLADVMHWEQLGGRTPS